MSDFNDLRSVADCQGIKTLNLASLSFGRKQGNSAAICKAVLKSISFNHFRGRKWRLFSVLYESHFEDMVSVTLSSHPTVDLECRHSYQRLLFFETSRIGQNQSTIVCPVIDTIDWNTFEFYMQTDEPMIGGFDWRLTFQWHAVPEVERKRRTSHIDPIR
jgi:hypothetical protein